MKDQMMKRLILALAVALAAVAGARGQEMPETYFPYPIVPDSIKSLQGRCDYLARHFWKFCDLKKAFSAKARMAQEFGVYLNVISNAHPDSAVASVKRLMQALEKQPGDMLFLAREAEGRLYSDTAEVWVDELYLPIAEAVVANKRVDKASKARFAHQATVLRNSMTGKRLGGLPYVTREGERRDLAQDTAQVTLVYFFDPDCGDCHLARTRLNADVSMTELIDEGKVKVVAISLTEPTEEWRAEVAQYPAKWTVGAAPDADLAVDLRAGTPDFYILDKNGRVRFKHLVVDQVLDVARQLKKR